MEAQQSLERAKTRLADAERTTVPAATGPDDPAPAAIPVAPGGLPRRCSRTAARPSRLDRLEHRLDALERRPGTPRPARRRRLIAARATPRRDGVRRRPDEGDTAARASPSRGPLHPLTSGADHPADRGIGETNRPGRASAGKRGRSGRVGEDRGDGRTPDEDPLPPRPAFAAGRHQADVPPGQGYDVVNPALPDDDFAASVRIARAAFDEIAARRGRREQPGRGRRHQYRQRARAARPDRAGLAAVGAAATASRPGRPSSTPRPTRSSRSPTAACWSRRAGCPSR